MNKTKSTLFLVVLIAITATTTSADGQIPIGGNPVFVPNNEISSKISDYLLMFSSIIGQLKF